MSTQCLRHPSLLNGDDRILFGFQMFTFTSRNVSRNSSAPSKLSSTRTDFPHWLVQCRHMQRKETSSSRELFLPLFNLVTKFLINNELL